PSLSSPSPSSDEMQRGCAGREVCTACPDAQQLTCFSGLSLRLTESLRYHAGGPHGPPSATKPAPKGQPHPQSPPMTEFLRTLLFPSSASYSTLCMSSHARGTIFSVDMRPSEAYDTPPSHATPPHRIVDATRKTCV